MHYWLSVKLCLEQVLKVVTSLSLNSNKFTGCWLLLIKATNNVGGGLLLLNKLLNSIIVIRLNTFIEHSQSQKCKVAAKIQFLTVRLSSSQITFIFLIHVLIV